MGEHLPEPAVVVKDDPKRPYKAYVSTAIAFVSTFVAFWIADTDPLEAKEIGQGILLAAAASGITGGATFGVSNPKKVAR